MTRRYRNRTKALETSFRTPTGTVEITDALAASVGNRRHELGNGAPDLCYGVRRALTEKAGCL